MNPQNRPCYMAYPCDTTSALSTLVCTVLQNCTICNMMCMHPVDVLGNGRYTHSMFLLNIQYPKAHAISAHDFHGYLVCITMLSRRRMPEHPNGAYTAYSVFHTTRRMVCILALRSLNTMTYRKTRKAHVFLMGTTPSPSRRQSMECGRISISLK